MTEADVVTTPEQVEIEPGIHLCAIVPGSVKLLPMNGANVVEFTLLILSGRGGVANVPMEMCRPRAGARHAAKQDWNTLFAWATAVGANGRDVDKILGDMVLMTICLGGVYLRLGFRSEGPKGEERLVIGRFSGVDIPGDMETPRGQ